ncbi:FAD-dependent oxidoreductase [Okeania hirsuta]|uniref:FAD-dependent oxidoreductase n=1 Tax=Okeania hirsuta TaxID=1458930 RepID=UPI000F528EC7|nr:FAD-dependent monooxygenase [Okeania hirsuta]RQH25750.1 monooxygenase [Okeania hirsuta]
MIAQNTRIGIVGAGTTGTYLTYLLAKKGYQVDLFEKYPAPRTDGCGILLISPGMQAIHQGNPELCYQLIEKGVPAKTFEFRNLKDEVVKQEQVEYEEKEIPGILIHRKAILESILAYLPEYCLHCNACFSHLEQTEDKVIAYFEDGSHWEGDLLIGCDGIYSKLRNFVVPDVKLCYLGNIIWRGIVKEDEFCQDGRFLLYVRSSGIYASFFDIGHGYTHWGFFLEKDQEESECNLPRPHNIGIPDQELAKVPETGRKIIESTPNDQIVCNFSYDIDPIPQLYHGNVLLIGDAAHAKSPSRGRGMTSGFEDALALSRYLEEGETINEALAKFQAERLPIVHEYQRTSREISPKTERKSREKNASKSG